MLQKSQKFTSNLTSRKYILLAQIKQIYLIFNKYLYSTEYV